MKELEENVAKPHKPGKNLRYCRQSFSANQAKFTACNGAPIGIPARSIRFSHDQSDDLPMVEVGNWQPESRSVASCLSQVRSIFCMIFLGQLTLMTSKPTTSYILAINLVMEDRNGCSTSRLSNAR
jgi:hypothetical protein